MRLVLRLLLAGITLTGAAATPVLAQTPVDGGRPRFRSAADLVSIQTSVRDKRGRPLAGLTPADFEVRDNGQVRPLISLRSDRQSPVSIAVLVDVSGSMSVGSKAELARQSFDALVRRLHESEDELAVFTFDSELHERRPFTKHFAALNGVLDEFEPFGSTSLYDATAATARRLAKRSATHKAIIILTDGVDTSSSLSAAEVSGLASAIDVPVYIVATTPSIDQNAIAASGDRPATTASADLRDLAEWTGGRLVLAGNFLTTVTAATSLLEELRQQYVLAIEAAAVNEWRRLEVRVKEKHAIVKARSGYFGG
jgi:VWFA-related protein